MKFLQLTFHFEYSDSIESILDKHDIANYIRVRIADGKDCDGKHYGTQVFPGNSTVIQAHIHEEKIDALFEDLRAFRDVKRSRHHVQAVILPIEQTL